MKKCYLVGRHPSIEGKSWEVQGVYDDEDDAKKACIEYDWFVMPIKKNTALPLESFSVGYYPNQGIL